jgi:hypothetical protein
MPENNNVRWGWLKGMYIYTIISAGGLGLGIIIAPEVIRSLFGWPAQDPIVLGVFGSVYVAFAVFSILGLRSPLKFAPVLFLQLCCKRLAYPSSLVPLGAVSFPPERIILRRCRQFTSFRNALQDGFL